MRPPGRLRAPRESFLPKRIGYIYVIYFNQHFTFFFTSQEISIVQLQLKHCSLQKSTSESYQMSISGSCFGTGRSSVSYFCSRVVFSS